MEVYLLFIIGLFIGSFVNATIWRLKDGEKVFNDKKIDKSRSICEHCHHQLAVKDLIPLISWLALKGKCRYCKKAINISHPLFELAMGTVFAVSWLAWPTLINSAQDMITFIVWLVILASLVGLAVYDIRHLEIDNKIIYTLLALAMAWRLVDATFWGGGAGVMQELTLGLLVGGGFFLSIFYMSGGKWIGGGDVKLGFLIGAWLGPLYSVVALAVAFYSAFLVVVPLMLAKKVSRKQPVPFGPFLIAGIFVATLWGTQMVDWYQTLLV